MNPESLAEDLEPNAESPLTTFLLRLESMRRGLVGCALALAAGTTVGWTVSQPLYELLARPLTRELASRGQDARLAFTHLTDPFVLYFTVSLLAGVFLTSPAVAWQLWRLARPRQGWGGRLRLAGFVLASVVLFGAGLAFGYFVLLPFAVRYLLEIGGDFEQLITVREYLRFATRLLLVLGGAAQLPLLTLVLARAGILGPGALWRGFPYAVLVAFVVAALITPPDGISQLLVAVPVLGLYLVGIGVAALARPRPDVD